MGTNYYLVKNGPTVREPIHIGKLSFGWLFLFQEQTLPYNDPPIVWHTYPQVKEVLKKLTLDSKDYIIIDEYDNITPYDEFIDTINITQMDEQRKNNPDNFHYAKNIDGYRFVEEDFS